MLVHVLVLGVLVDLHAQRRELRQELLGEAGVDQDAQPHHGVGGRQQLRELVPDPLGGDPAEFGGHAPHRVQGLRVDPEPELRGEAGRAEHPQRIVRERGLGRGRGADRLPREVRQAAERVGELVARHRDRHRVHREVAPLQIVDEAVAVPHDRVAAHAVVRVRAEGGHLDLLAPEQAPDRPEVGAGGPDRRAVRPQDRLGRLRARVRREIEVAHAPAQHRVPDRAADQMQLEAAVREHPTQFIGYGRDRDFLTATVVRHRRASLAESARMAEPSARPGPGHSPSGPVRGPQGNHPYGTPPNAYPQTGNGYAPIGTPTPAPAPPQGKNVVRSSLLMGAGSLVSRVTGFGRTVVISAAIGAGLLGNSYTTAQYFPQMIYELVLGGVFASIILPLFVKAHKNDPDGGDAFAQRLLTLAALVLGAAAILVTACAPLIARFMANPDQYDLVTEFSYYMLPALLFYGLFAILSGVLNSREHFGAPMWVPILNNLVVITVGALFYVIYTRDAVPVDGKLFNSADQVTNGMVLLLGLGTTAGVVLQVLCLAPALRKAGFRWRLRFDFKALPLRTIRQMAAWTLLFVAANQIAVMAVIKVANGAAAEQTATGPFVPGVTVYNNAYLMMMMAHGIVAVSVITALMPRMTRAADGRHWPELADHLSNGIRLASFLLVPIAAAFIALHEPIGLMIFQWGAYTPEEALATGQVLAMAGIVLLPFSISQLQIYAFYAQTDTRTVAMFNLPVIAIRIGGYLLAFAFLPPEWVVVGLFAANGVSYLVSLLLSMSLLRRRIGLLGMRKTLNGLVRTTTAAVIAGGVAYGGWLLWPDLPVDGGMAKLGQFAASIVLGLVLLGVYFAACLVLRVTETASLQATVRAKLRR